MNNNLSDAKGNKLFFLPYEIRWRERPSRVKRSLCSSQCSSKLRYNVYYLNKVLIFAGNLYVIKSVFLTNKKSETINLEIAILDRSRPYVIIITVDGKPELRKEIVGAFGNLKSLALENAVKQ